MSVLYFDEIVEIVLSPFCDTLFFLHFFEISDVVIVGLIYLELTLGPIVPDCEEWFFLEN